MAKRKASKKRTGDSAVQEAWIAELEDIAEELKTSTVSFTRKRLLQLAEKMKAAKGQDK